MLQHENLYVDSNFRIHLQVLGTHFLEHLDEFVHLLLALHLVLPGADIDTAGTYFIRTDNELETAWLRRYIVVTKKLLCEIIDWNFYKRRKIETRRGFEDTYLYWAI